MLPKPALPRFVELIRVSTAGQAARDTPQDQGFALDGLRRYRPGTFVERIEAQVSGAADVASRPDLARLAELAEARAFDEVRVRHLDRLTRHDDPLERAIVLSMVRRAGAVIVDAGGSVLDPTTTGGELQWVFSTLASGDERRKIRERTMAAKRRLAAEGRLVCGRPPWGRTWDKKSGWGTDANLDTYRRIFDLCLRGRTLSQIAETLNDEGVLSPRGKPWEPSNLARLMHDPAAKGAYDVKGTVVPVPPVVDEATWDAAQKRLAEGKGYSGPKPTVFAMLRRIVACGECGALLRVRIGGKAPRRSHYYVCASTCSGYHDTEKVDEAVRTALEAFLSRPGALRAAAQGGGQENAADDARAALAKAEKELRDLDKREERAARLLATGAVSERAGQKLLAEVKPLRARAEREKTQAEATLAAAERAAEMTEQIEERVEAIRAGLADATPAEWRELAILLFARGGVTLHRDGRIDLRGALPLDDRGEAALTDAARPPAAPIRLSARSRVRTSR